MAPDMWSLHHCLLILLITLLIIACHTGQGQARILTVGCKRNAASYNDVTSSNDVIVDSNNNFHYGSLQDAILESTDYDVIVLTADNNCMLNDLINGTLNVTGMVTITSGDSSGALIGYSEDAERHLVITLSEDANVSFVNLRFSRVIFNVLLGHNVTVLWFNCTLDDSRFMSSKHTGNAHLSIKNTTWRNVNANWTSDMMVVAHRVDFLMENSRILQTNISIHSSHIASVIVHRCLFTNHLPVSRVFGGLYVNIVNTHHASTVIIRHSTFTFKTYNDPVDSVMNLYEAALRVRAPNPRVKPPISNVSVLIDTCHFAHNERGLTLSGGFRSIIISNCIFEDNIAMHAGAAILFLIDSMLPSARVLNCAFLRNKAGQYRPEIVEGYRESFQLIGDDVRIQSACCRGIISLVGKGGAVRVQTGHVTFDGCQFVNNSARLLGGAIFIDRGLNLPDRSVKENLNKVVLANTLLANHVPLNQSNTQGSLFYSNGQVTIQSAELVTTVAKDHTTILSHSSDHWSIEVVNITVICPVGYKVRMTNASTYGIEPTKGLKRSYMLDQLSYACESCPRHKYSLDRGYIRSRRVYDNANEKIHFVFMINGQCPDDGITGTYEHHDVTCLHCPYGGRCQQGEGITAVANFWGYPAGNQMRFQRCPKGYCCTSAECPSYDTCADHREGRLCSRCREGYSEAFFSSQCLPDGDCNPLWLVAFGAFSSIVYSLFLLFQKDIRELMFFHSILSRGQRLTSSNQGHGQGQSKKNGSSANGDDAPKSSFVLLHPEYGTCTPATVVTNGQSEATASLLHHRSKHQQRHHNGKTYSTPSGTTTVVSTIPSRPQPAAVDAGASFIIILFFYFQDVQLLHVKTVFASDEVAQIGKLRTFLAGIFKFQVDIFQFFDDMCVLPGTTPVMKVLMMTMLVPLVICIFAALFFVYKCLSQPEADSAIKRPAHFTVKPAGSLSMQEAFILRIATGFSLALLFTYQNLASAALTLLNCVPVNDTSVLYIDGDVECYQPWQYGIMAYTVVMVLPFCAVIFYGPGLLRDCLISLPHFFCACVLPLPFLIAWICLRLCLNGRKPPNAGQAPFEVKAVIQILQGPFKDAQTRLLGPTCGQGIVLGRRLILILLFTFVNDSLMRMLCMNLFCFIMLLHHVHVLPYKDRRGNLAGSASASALVIVAGINLVRAAFEAAEYLPHGPYEVLVNIFDHVENVLVLWLPAAILSLVIVALTLRLLCGRVIAAAVRCCCSCGDAGGSDSENESSSNVIEMTPL